MQTQPSPSKDTALSCCILKVKQEEASGKVSKHSLLELAHCYLTSPFTVEEGREAVALLAKYRLWRLANRHFKYVAQSFRFIELEKALPYNFRCVHCGLPLTKDESIERGCGDVCRRKHRYVENKPKGMDRKFRYDFLDISKSLDCPDIQKRIQNAYLDHVASGVGNSFYVHIHGFKCKFTVDMKMSGVYDDSKGKFYGVVLKGEVVDKLSENELELLGSHLKGKVEPQLAKLIEENQPNSIRLYSGGRA